MRNFQRILISLVGDTDEFTAVERGVSLARRVGASVTLVDVVEDPPWYLGVLPATSTLFDEELRARRERLESLASSLGAQAQTVSTELLRGRPEIETIRQVLRGGHDLVVKRAQEGEDGLVVSPDMRLLRNCPCPVWLVRRAQESRLFARILAAVDPVLDEADASAAQKTALNQKILDLATSLADWQGAELHVIHAWEPIGEGLSRRWGIGSEEVITECIEQMHTAARRALDHVVAPYLDRIGAAHLHLINGDPGQAIPSFAATHRVDLIVMGTVARTGISGLIIGNTAETILQRVRCSVLAVKPDGFVSPVSPVEPGGSPWVDPGSR